MGSSPLTRGKPLLRVLVVPATGLIPAHAGKTQRVQIRIRITRAHPRSRGENPIVVVYKLRHWGSSPLARGKRLPIRRSLPRSGLIPAHAGKTVASRHGKHHPGAHPRSRGKTRSKIYVFGKNRAHPRSRGENTTYSILLPPRPGSSPLTRENCRIASEKTQWVGSSPLTRGKLEQHPPHDLHVRLIPAHAGKTTSPPKPRFPSTAHPRSRGENILG